MNLSSDARLKQVQRYGTGLRRLSKFFFALTAFAGTVVILLLVFADSGDMNFSIGGVTYEAEAVPASVRVIAIVGALFAMALLLKLLFHAIRLFDLYANGKIFTVENVRQIRQIGISVFLFIGLWFFDLLMQLLVSNANIRVAEAVAEGGASESAELTLTLGSPFGIAILGTVIIFFSWIMDVGRELREDQDLVV